MGQVYGERWEIVRDLGEGGQGQAFVVKDRKAEADEQQYVLKRLTNVKRCARFEKEVEAISKLNHPHVLRLVDSDVKAEPRPYLVSEYCRRGNLEENKAAILEMELDAVMGLFEKILAGVSHIHDAKIVHRDVKPANIFLRDDGSPVVGDFGLVYIEETNRPTETLEAVGARWYMAPELAEGRLDEVTPRADVYSLGKLLYWMLTGNIFDRERHRTERNNILKYYSDETMEHVNLLLDNMLVEDYLARYADAGSVAGHFSALRRLVRGGYPSLTVYPRLCRYCGRDVYEKLDSEGAALRNMGISAVSGSRWSIFRCNTCGHLLMFHNDVWTSKAKPLPENLA